MYQKLERMIRGVVSRAIVNSRAASKLYQVLWLDDRVSADVEYFEPQGVHFNAAGDAVGALLSPGGNKSASVLLCASGASPSDATAPGEGGLHYLGTYKVFCKADGTLALGAYAPADFVALASRVNAELDMLKTAIAGWTPVALDGGLALKTALAAFIAATPTNVGSTTVRAE